MLAQEEEVGELLKELTGDERAAVYELSRSTSRSASAARTPTRSSWPRRSSRPQARSPPPPTPASTPASCASPSCGSRRCRLGRDVAGLTRKYVTRHVGDTLPLVGTRCGSPTGIPFAFTEPGRAVELLNPFDPAHDNGTLLVNARSGGGKTFPVNVSCRPLPGPRHAGLRARPGRPLRLPLLARPRRAPPHDRRLARMSTRSTPGTSRTRPEAADREDHLPGRAARAAGRRPPRRRRLLRPRRAGAQPARGRHPRRLRPRRPRAASTRASGCCPTSCAAAPSRRPSAGATEVAAELRTLAERLASFCGEGSYAYLLDRATTVPADAPLVAFDTRKVPERDRPGGAVRAGRARLRNRSNGEAGERLRYDRRPAPSPAARCW